MDFQSMEKWRVQKRFGINDSQYEKIVKRVVKRHPNEYWIYKKIALNGEKVEYLKLEFVEWLDDVYFNKDKYYLDAEIDFFRKQVVRLENDLNFPHNKFEYKDISLKGLRQYFGKSKNAIGVAVNRMEKRNEKSFKYIEDGKVMISNEGVKWLSENYFRKEYLKKLEYYKLELQNVKRKLNNYKEINIVYF